MPEILCFKYAMKTKETFKCPGCGSSDYENRMQTGKRGRPAHAFLKGVRVRVKTREIPDVSMEIFSDALTFENILTIQKAA